MKIIDLQELIDKEAKGKDGKAKYDYFLCSRRGDVIVEPFKDETENNGLGVIVDDGMICDNSESDVDHDSCDSNREDAEQNDYPEEEYGSQHSSSDDEERAINRYNAKAAKKAQAAQLGP